MMKKGLLLLLCLGLCFSSLWGQETDQASKEGKEKQALVQFKDHLGKRKGRSVVAAACDPEAGTEIKYLSVGRNGLVKHQTKEYSGSLPAWATDLPKHLPSTDEANVLRTAYLAEDRHRAAKRRKTKKIILWVGVGIAGACTLVFGPAYLAAAILLS